MQASLPKWSRQPTESSRALRGPRGRPERPAAAPRRARPRVGRCGPASFGGRRPGHVLGAEGEVISAIYATLPINPITWYSGMERKPGRRAPWTLGLLVGWAG